MKQLFICCCLLLACTGARAQSDTLVYDCFTASYQHARRFRIAYTAGDITAAKRIHDDWVSYCGVREVTNRAYLLLILATNDFLDVQQLELQYRFMYAYRDRMYYGESAYDYNRAYYGFVPVNKDFDRFTAREFARMDFPENPEYQFLADLYANAEALTYDELLAPRFTGSTLRNLYSQDLEAALRLPDTYYSVNVGAWVPNDRDDQLGVHPEISFQGGVRRDRFLYSLLIGFKFLNARDPYLARRETSDPFEETTKFFGGTIAADISYHLIDTKKFAFALGAGIGYDGFDTHNDQGELDASSVGSFLAFAKTEVKYKLPGGQYLGAYARYNHLDYSRGDKVRVDADPVSIGLTYGVIFNAFKEGRLNALQYQRQD